MLLQFHLDFHSLWKLRFKCKPYCTYGGFGGYIICENDTCCRDQIAGTCDLYRNLEQKGSEAISVSFKKFQRKLMGSIKKSFHKENSWQNLKKKHHPYRDFDSHYSQFIPFYSRFVCFCPISFWNSPHSFLRFNTYHV